MLKAARLIQIPQIRFGGFVVQSTRFYSKKDAQEPPIEPLQMSYNSYEDLSSDSSTPPVIIMHGLFGSKQNWRSISKAIHTKTNPTRKVIAVDARNHGESPHSPNHRYVDLAEDIHLFCKEHKIPKAVVIGHSMGGRAMMVFALKYPHLVEKAIIVDVSPVTTSPALKNMGAVFSAMRRVSLPSDIELPEARILADKQMQKFIPDKVTRSFILMNLYRAVNGVIKWRSNVDSLDDNFVKHIARFLGPQHFPSNNYTAPILFVGGLRSDYLTAPNELERIREIYPQAELKFLDTGHLVQVEAPNEFIRLAVDFINEKYYGWSVNPDGLEKHYDHLTTFPEYLKQNQFNRPILLLGGNRSDLVKETQLEEIRNYYPKVQMKILRGGHNIGLVDSRDEFLNESLQFIDAMN